MKTKHRVTEGTKACPPAPPLRFFDGAVVPVWGVIVFLVEPEWQGNETPVSVRVFEDFSRADIDFFYLCIPDCDNGLAGVDKPPCFTGSSFQER